MVGTVPQDPCALFEGDQFANLVADDLEEKNPSTGQTESLGLALDGIGAALDAPFAAAAKLGALGVEALQTAADIQLGIVSTAGQAAHDVQAGGGSASVAADAGSSASSMLTQMAGGAAIPASVGWAGPARSVGKPIPFYHNNNHIIPRSHHFTEVKQCVF